MGQTLHSGVARTGLREGIMMDAEVGLVAWAEGFYEVDQIVAVYDAVKHTNPSRNYQRQCK